MINITVAGKLGKDAEIRAAGKDNVTSFSVASDSKYGKEKTTIWIDCSIFGKRGEALAPYLKKGNPVTVVGELTQREHNGKTYLGCRVDHIELQGKSGSSESSGGSSRQSPAPSTDLSTEDDSDIPF